MKSNPVSYLKDPNCLQMKVELSKMKDLPVHVINYIVDDYVNDCCPICQQDREDYECYILKDNDECEAICRNWDYLLFLDDLM